MTNSTHYLLALDSFKECLSSAQANAALESGIRALSPQSVVTAVDVSDGGEGFLDAMRPAQRVYCYAHDAMMRPEEVAYGVSGDTAIIEVARIIGLAAVAPDLRNPLRATSFGVGEVIAHAWNQGCRHFIIGLGGTATSDCGLGMLKALKFSAQRRRGLSVTAPFDTSVLRAIRVTLATDVKAPLLGPEGAARMFAPQKGATPEQVEQLERQATKWAEMAARHQGIDCSKQPGAGAAGGLGYAFMEFTDATVRPGAELVLDAVHFDRLAREADLIVTGEGHADAQTLLGKLPAVVLHHGQQAGKPVALVCGRADDAQELLNKGFSRVVDINEGYPAFTPRPADAPDVDILGHPIPRHADANDPLNPTTAQARLKAAARRIVD
jgi:glycerate kinase